MEKQSNVNLSLLKDETITFEYGWVFFYQSAAFVETGDLITLVGGNAHIIVDKSDGSVTMTGTSREVE